MNKWPKSLKGNPIRPGYTLRLSKEFALPLDPRRRCIWRIPLNPPVVRIHHEHEGLFEPTERNKCRSQNEVINQAFHCVRMWPHLVEKFKTWERYPERMKILTEFYQRLENWRFRKFGPVRFH